MATTKGVALFSGGLDSILAFKVLQEQGIDVQGVTFETPFFNAAKARATACAKSAAVKGFCSRPTAPFWSRLATSPWG